jgi:hypothetical protein
MTATTSKEKSAPKEKAAYTSVTMTFKGLEVSTNWFHPKLSPVMCALCGKQCKERGVPLCVNGNPFCG